MKVAVSDDAWCEFHKRVTVLGLPQVPDAGIVRRYAGLIEGRDGHILLLGITRALADLGRSVTAIDFSETQIERTWPGDTPTRRAVLGDWREMEPEGRPCTAAIGDGSLSALAWPDEYRNVLGRIGDMLAPGGIAVIRCYIAPDLPETVEQVVEDVWSGRERDWNAARWRIAMAATDPLGNIGAAELARTWRSAFPDFDALAARTGWNVEAMTLIEGSFLRSSLRYSFVAREALLDALPISLASPRFVASGHYPLSERCPFFVAERTG